VGLDACSPALEAGAGTDRHPGTWIAGGAGLAAAVVSDCGALVEAVVVADPATVFVVAPEEPHAATINAAAAAPMTETPGLPVPRGRWSGRQEPR
jgi:hypothetical protein